MEARQAAPAGTSVYDAGGELLGTIESSDAAYLMVDSGDIPPVYYIPVSAIVETREDGVYLSASRADAQHQGWGREPEADDGSEIGTTVEPATTYTAIQGEDSLDEDPMPTPGDR